MSTLSDEQRNFFEKEVCGFWDYYWLTPDRTIRRVTMPKRRWVDTMWLFWRETNTDTALFDREAHRWAEEHGCGFAEALSELIDRYCDTRQIRDNFMEDTREEAKREEITEAFFREQDQREQLWRIAHNDWRKDLPPALD